MPKTLLLALMLAAPLPARAAAAKKPAKRTRKAANAGPRVTTLHEKFLALDVNADGVIDDGEMHAYEIKLAGVGAKGAKKLDPETAAKESASLWAEFKRDDSDHDGKVTEAEFVAAESSATAPSAR